MARVALLGLGLVAGCIVPGHFVCDGSDDCGDGRCDGGSCVMPDASCPSHERYSKYAHPDLAGICFEGELGTTAESSGGESSGGASSSSGTPAPVERCNGIDDDGNGLVDEWSPENPQCELCPSTAECMPCDLFPDDEEQPTRVYYLCHRANYNEIVAFCDGLGAPVASIHDDEENTLLAIEVTAHAQYKTAYIGLRDFGVAGSPMWTWIDGTPFDYERLGDQLDTHEPDDVCAAITSSGAWEAAHCFGGRSFVCEAELPDR